MQRAPSTIGAKEAFGVTRARMKNEERWKRKQRWVESSNSEEALRTIER
jgi:hypothetical protein